MKAILGAGCFWGVEKAFKRFGKTRVGYTGGTAPNPTYHQVCSGKTGHLEAVLIETTEPYEYLLDTFWQIHDPTTPNRQRYDVGTQYRSAIFYFDDDQKEKALASLEREQKKLGKKIVTEVLPAQEFFEAEEYHQNYLEKNMR